MLKLWPPDEAGDVDRAELERLYGYPDGPPQWLAMNFVSSVDGAVELGGRSRGLSNAADREVYPLGSRLADVLLVGANTAVVEEFRGVDPDAEHAALRERHGLAPVPRIAVVTTGRTLPPDAPVLTDVHVPTVVITCAAAPASLREQWAAAGAEVLVAGDEEVDFRAATGALAQRGLRRIHCDGGPRLFGSLLEAGLVDELRLTLSPMLVSGAADRIAKGAGIEPARLQLASVLAQDDTLMIRYLVQR
ncbi:pyrimidine reductase family protein [Saccharopolyspora rhizosphaerae]|uniref:Pyrimidine reductase family protein n=1 Tax=Saccharopolyspora rhizosphaerae TaxID=2492662 RepID=A0A426JJ08_9PSEU|nr:pyrimidine reductase family protein [Saccharopolyspora rhizosphaerae]RRO13149.1 pyrimidine reductase family protein [Saccharopolyspora rhizosphaerae]